MNLNKTDRYCLDCFPELLARFSRSELEDASDSGSYIFHEDYFCEWVTKAADTHSLLQRVSDYIEHLASSENCDQRNLAQIGIIECLINHHFDEIAPYLKKGRGNWWKRQSRLRNLIPTYGSQKVAPREVKGCV